MSNMSYCRHENTANDLQDVVDMWRDDPVEEMSEYEKRGRQRIIELAKEICEMEGII